jgi:hypothetical protein
VAGEIHYADPKEAVAADVDGDGLYEVDIAYSLEDGAGTWRVDRYRWDGQVYDYTETYSRTAAEAVPLERYRAMAAAVEALYDLRDLSGDGEPPSEVQVLAQEVDADGDGRPETLLAYHLRVHLAAALLALPGPGLGRAHALPDSQGAAHADGSPGPGRRPGWGLGYGGPRRRRHRVGGLRRL